MPQFMEIGVFGPPTTPTFQGITQGCLGLDLSCLLLVQPLTAEQILLRCMQLLIQLLTVLRGGPLCHLGPQGGAKSYTHHWPVVSNPLNI